MEQRSYGHASAPHGIPQQRIVKKLDEYMGRRDYAGAQRHLEYWLQEAVDTHDDRGQLMVRNELVGHFRKAGDRKQAFMHAEAALQLLETLGLQDTLSAGTTYTNVGTAYNAFGRDEEALALFRKAAHLYEGSAQTDPGLLGGLYNNMALACVSLQRFEEAGTLYGKALAAMEKVENGELEQAITYLNMADAVAAEYREAPRGDSDGAVCGDDDAACEREIEKCLDRAMELLDTPGIPHDGYYAFVCEKCAPAFAHHGYFLADADLRERARAIYERT